LANEKLKVYNHNQVYRIGWYIPEDQEIGATLGEDTNVKDLPADDEHAVATKYLLSIECEIDSFGFYWTSKSAAIKTLREIKAQFKNKEYPDWAKKALVEGWKPPKNWKP
jgi:hypothetical protein